MIGERLKQLRKEHGYTQRQLAQKLQVDQTAVSYWEQGKTNPDMERQIALADLFSVSVDYLWGREARSSSPAEGWLSKRAVPAEPGNGEVMVPILGSVRAGTGGLAEQQIIGYEPAPARYLSGGQRCFWLEVEGDSMQPRIEPGDMILVQARPSIDSGDLAVVTVDDDEGVVKKVFYGRDWIELRSFNPYYPPRRFEGEDVGRIRVMGKVVKSERRY